MAEERIRRQELIEQYLLGQLEGEVLQDFTLQLMRDQQLQKEVDAHRILMKSLWKNTTSSAVKTNKSSNNIRKWSLMVLGLVIIIALTYWGAKNNNQTNTSEQTLPDIEEKNIIPPTEVIDTPVIIEQKEIFQDSPEKSQPQDNQREQEDPVPISPPIAANFDPNPALESYLGQLRGGELEINNPTQISTFTLDNGKVNFQLSGTFTSDMEEVLTIHFFSNKKEDYEQFRPVLSEQLPVNERNMMEWEKELELAKGLYYYQIEGEESGLLYVGKVEILD